MYSTLTLTPMVAGALRSSKDFCSRSSVMLTQSHKELVAGRATSSSALQTLHPPSRWLVFLTTPLHLTLILTLMTRVTPSLVFCKVSIAYTSILILLTLPPVMPHLATSIMFVDIRVLALMTLAFSTALTFHYRWCVQLVRTPSSRKLALRPATGSLPPPSQKELPKVSEHLVLPRTATIVALLLRTLCEQDGYIPFTFQRTLPRVLFFV